MTRRGLIQSILLAMGLGVSTVARAAERLSYDASCRRLIALGYLDGAEVPPMPTRLPRYDDAVPGVSFLRQMVEIADLSGLTLPRTFFGRSEINAVNFSNTDLSQSNLAWNDFLEVDFSGASLAGGDLRASQYLRCRFDGADLRGADLRRSTFDNCSFADALLDGAVATKKQLSARALTASQWAVIDWRDDEGPEPDGG